MGSSRGTYIVLIPYCISYGNRSQDNAQDHPYEPEYWSTAPKNAAGARLKKQQWSATAKEQPGTSYPKCSWSATPEVNEERKSSSTPVFVGVATLCYDLQWTEVMIKSEDDCSKTYENTDVNYDNLTMICAIAPVSTH